jgi:hypothetical protein
MNSTKKLMLAAGIFLQLSTGLYAASWEDAINGFGGAANVFNNHGKKLWSEALKQANINGGSPEDLAVGLYVSKEYSKPSIIMKFPGAAPTSELEAALENIMNPSRSFVPQDEPQEPASSGYSSWWSGSSAQTFSKAQVDAAQAQAAQAQKNEDAVEAAASQQALINVQKSGVSGVQLYKKYVDVAFNSLQNAVNGLDASSQQDVVRYIQDKAANMSASSGGPFYKSRTLGRMNSKKAHKKSSKKRK